uniref:Phosphoglucomutase n=1 Tax=Panagrolaimus davidi TaxID=227884 RepID=A0A914QBH6_9BILA
MGNPMVRCATENIRVGTPMDDLYTLQYEKLILSNDTVASFGSKYGNCNVFLRPSGTENYMRLKVDMEKGDDPKALELLVSVIQNGVRLVGMLL